MIEVTKMIIAAFFTLIGIAANDPDCPLKPSEEDKKVIDAARKHMKKVFKA
jgi:hypothetical protein